MRNPLNKLLKKFGYAIVKISRFDEILKARKQQKEDFFFVQVGANDGVRFDRLYFFVTQNHCKGLVIEPLADMFEKLVRNYKDYPDIVPVNTALHPTAETCTLYRVDPARQNELPHWAAGIASFDPNHHKKSNIPEDCIIQEEVKCTSLMALLESRNIHDIDLLQVDTEGFDAEIIRMIDFARISPAIIKYERAHLSAEDQVSTENVLRSHGYKIFHEGSDTIAFKP
jgi:FkbM family methyltransferase